VGLPLPEQHPGRFDPGLPRRGFNPRLGLPLSGQYPVSGIRHPVSSIPEEAGQYPASSIQYPVSSIYELAETVIKTLFSPHLISRFKGKFPTLFRIIKMN
jgi:hypothetical protein